jgi:hypothetical protein
VQEDLFRLELEKIIFLENSLENERRVSRWKMTCLRLNLTQILLEKLFAKEKTKVEELITKELH